MTAEADTFLPLPEGMEEDDLVPDPLYEAPELESPLEAVQEEARAQLDGLINGEKEIAAWYLGVAESDLHYALAQRRKFGGSDLDAVSAGLRALAKQVPQGPVAMTGAALFYLQGETARCLEFVSKGEAPPADLLRKVTVLSMITRRVVDSGSW